MKKKCVQVVLFLLLTYNASAGIGDYFMGGYKKTYIKAEKLLNNGNYDEALSVFLLLDSLEKGNSNIQYKIGLCYLNASINKIKSIPYFLEATKNITENYRKNDLDGKHAPTYTYKYLAEAYQLNYDFDKAIEMYLKYKETIGTTPKLNAEVEDVMHRIETCTDGIDLMKNAKSVKVNNLGKAINSWYPDYSSVISGDGSMLMFTSRRPNENNTTKDSKGQYHENVYVSEQDAVGNWKEATLLGGQINTVGGNARIINTADEGQTLIIYKNAGNDGNLYLSNNVNGTWKTPQYWGSGINSIADETSASFTSDGRILYFVSRREGGYGGSDIYKCLKLPNGKLGPAQNLGPVVNTKYDEDAVFVSPNGKELFFSSNGHKSMGGFDILSSVIDPENGYLSAPLNVGYPINTTADDIYFKTSADGKTAYLSSDRANGLGGMDIYQIVYSEENEQRDITIIVGRIINNSKEDLSDNLILVIDKNTHETIQEIEANNATGKFGIDLPIGSTYEIQYFIKGKEIYDETVITKKGSGYQVIIREIPYGN